MSTSRIIRSLIASVAAASLLLGNAVFAADDNPSDVTNVKAVAGDASVRLTWDKAVSNTPLEGYRVYWGTQKVTNDPSTSYTDKKDVGDVLSYEVTGLENDKKYYFAVIAIDINKKTSAHYSDDASATPTDGSTESAVAPKVTAAVALNNREVKITFSKEVVLPSENPEKAFTVIENILQSKLEVTGAAITVDDKKSVILTTEPQTKAAEYVLTVHSDVTDKDQNPIVSGTSDTASFVGSSIEKVTTTPSAVASPATSPSASAEPTSGADITPPSIEEVTVEGNTKVTIMFSEPVVLSTVAPENHFSITEKDNPLTTIEIKTVAQSEDKKSVTLETALQKADAMYEIIVSQIVDNAGNSIPELLGNNKFEYTAKVAELKDIIPPEDVTNFVSKILGTSVRLTWTASIDTAKDLAEQIIYQSMDGKAFTEIAKLQPRITEYTVKNLKRGIEYTFKITQKDTSGNESKGAKLAVTLPETGMGISVALASAIGGLLYARRRKKRA